MYTDASDRFWSAVVTQTRPESLNLPLEEQRHEPLAFLGAEFKGAQLGWSTFEKEAYAIFQTFEKFDYVLMGSKPTHIYTDHRNLLFVFAPLTLEPALGRHILSKVQRWALFLSRFSYVIEHVHGETNVFADILTRWTKGYRNEKRILRTIYSLLESANQVIPSADDFIWPDQDIMRRSQEGASRYRSGCKLNPETKLWEKNGLVWTPEKDLELQLKVLVASHCGSIRHRGSEATKSVLKKNFIWDNMERDVEQLVQGCLHCIITRSGDLIPRPLSHAMHGERPNEVIHLDFLYMASSQDGKRYVLIVRDDHSGFVWLWPTSGTIAEEAVDGVIHWIGSFGTMDWFVSDQGSHFKNQLIAELTSELRVHHHFTTAYSPWANGTVERVCREVLRATRSLCSEWKLAPRDWPAVTECVQGVLNHAPLRGLGLRDCKKPGVYRTPMEVFTGHVPTRPLMRALPVAKYKMARSKDEIRLRQIVDIDATQSALESMHKQIRDRSDHSRKRQIEAHNKKTRVQPVNFQKRDFVLVRRAQNKGHKLKFLWTGPRKVIAVRSDLVFEVENLADGRCETVHARRLILYRADFDGVEVDPQLMRAAEHSEAVYQDAHHLCDIRERAGLIEIQVEWEGLPDKVDQTWEPLKSVSEDLPDMLNEFLSSSGKQRLKEKAFSMCSQF